jgi:VWFA-related protein
MKTIRSILSFLMLAGASTLFAQQPLVEKIDVSLVNIDVTVTSHGGPARGLTRDDFEVLEDGVPQTITNFYTIENAKEKTAAASSQSPAAAVVPPAPAERFRRNVLVIIDNRHLSFHNRDVALRKLEQFINDRFDSGTYDWSIAIISDTAHLLLPPTSDKERIHATLALIRDMVAGKTIRDAHTFENQIAPIIPTASLDSVTVNAAGNSGLDRLIAQSNRMQSAADAATTYTSILDVSRSFATAPGRKIILVLTGGFFDQDDALTSLEPSLSTGYNATLAQLRTWLVHEANASDVSISVIDAEGLIPTNVGADSHGPGGGVAGSTSPGSFYWIARQTGGQSFTGNFVDKSLRDFETSSSNFYSLAYRPSHPEDGKYHGIVVRLKQPGHYLLSYRSGYSSIPVEDQLDRAMQSLMSVEIQPSSIPVTLTTGAVTAEPRGSVLVPVFAALQAKELQFVPTGDGSVARIDFFVSLFNDDGRLVRTFRTVREAHAAAGSEGEGKFVESHALRLRKGRPYRIVVAVHDQVSDAVGIKSQTVRF